MYLQGRYEIQVLDSYGLPPDKHGCGAIYGRKKPKENACTVPQTWQTYDITFRAPRFDRAGKKTQPARFVSVTLNGKKIHENVDVPDPTGGGLEGEEKPTGPILLQGDEGHGAWRNVRVKPVELN